MTKLGLVAVAMLSGIGQLLPNACAADAPPPAAGVERSRLFAFADGDRLEDAGVIVVKGGRFARTEAFEEVRRADGGRTLTSTTAAADGSYRVEGRWTYDADELALSAHGLGSYGGTPANVDITAAPPAATIAVVTNGAERQVTAPCDPCLIDMSPSALPMFTMTRRYDQARGGVQTFHWIGRGLIQDIALTEGHADLLKVRTAQIPGPDGAPVTVNQYRFVETLKDSTSGRELQLAFNLYVDGANRPLGFAMQKGTAGMRTGYDDLTARMPPVFEPEGAP
ncbi:MAG TPA: hypothetical protein VES73_10155 [Lamprocystis sp. (in: g-proteobacteria)]|nr:hypothetical protein [Lamprocystis sp. (in: g-proteobacteria)]